ncbi:hypothetical protein ACH0B5_11865 [Ureibacillus sp. 179-F W5.1 NHS]|uniref:Uncharacterized protein n=1 Tax=Lysinibacillus halotolerans TaxID=1368476 RepID=A0A3M8HFX6_9BACI|nr:hypothetical protein [Lysinibacillus halotolerans]RND01340.1 hypothetical protein EC501_01660 [Lysinibacillus halotolerans]
MYKKLSTIDFHYFIGQKITEVNTEKNVPFGMEFESGSLIIECPWRILTSNEVVIGYSDCLQSPDQYSYKEVEKILTGKRIVNIFHFEHISDLVLEAEGNIYVELFHDSNYFEGWQLRGDNEFYLVSLPGGSYAEF